MKKNLYIEPISGIAGDMLLAALLGLGVDDDDFTALMRSLPLPESWDIELIDCSRQGIAAKQLIVSIAGGEHSHKHRKLSEIEEIILGSRLDDPVKSRAIAVFRRLAEAEATVHGAESPDAVHFHEVGATDAILDICGVCLALEMLDVGRIYTHAPLLGRGTINSAHGILPVPAPATVALLRGYPVRYGGVDGELTTPTGAALLTTLVDEWNQPPFGELLASACGAGSREYDNLANVLRVSLLQPAGRGLSPSSVCVIECTLDDMPGERLSWLGPKLLSSGALDYAVIPVTMKKGRQGMIIQLVCVPEQREQLCELLLRETTSLGVRWRDESRVCLEREIRSIESPWGEFLAKFASDSDGRFFRAKPEYESCAGLAERNSTTYDMMYRRLSAILHELTDEQTGERS